MGIKVLQSNLQHAIDATSVLVKSIAQCAINVCLLQEPWIGGDGVLRGLSGFKGQIYGAEPAVKPRACILTSGLEAELLPQFTKRDLVAIKTKLDGVRTVIASAYFPHSKHSPPPEVVNLIQFCKEENFQCLIGCDANSHHVLWGSTDTNPRGEELLDYLCETDMRILNRGSKPTFQNAIRSEVLDMTIGCKKMEKLIFNWEVSDEETLSDHNYITFDIVLNSVPSNVTVMRNPRKTNWAKFKENLTNSLTRPPHELSNPDEIEAGCTELTNILLWSYENSCPTTSKRVRHETPWWNLKLEKLRAKLRRLANRSRRGNQPSLEAYKRTRREFKKEVRRSKRSQWRAFCHEIANLPTANRLQKAISKDRRVVQGPLTNRDGKFTKDDREALEVLMAKHFPDCELHPTSQSDVREEVSERTGWDHEINKIVTCEKIRHALKLFSPYKSPGKDGIYPVMLQQAEDTLVPYLEELFRACLKLSYIPLAWREIKVVFIPKPGRSDYTQPSAFRPISLSSFLLKTMERLMDWEVREQLKGEHALHDSQHAFRPGRSTDSALHNAVSYVEHNLSYKEMTLCCLFDIEGAFSNICLDAIRAALLRKNLSIIIVDWIMAMLELRIVVATRGDCSVTAKVSRGCGQGAITSPIVWCIVVDELLVILIALGVFAIAYADDVFIAVAGKDTSTISQLMQRALNKMLNWCSERQLGVNASKTQVVLFTRKTKVGQILLQLDGALLQLSSSVKYLGVHLDQKLLWNIQLEAAVTKGKNVLWAVKRCLSNTWGLTPKIVRWLYISVVRPILTYGSLVWWKRVLNVTVMAELSKLQRLACIAITGALRTTPTAALEILTDLIPLHIHIEGEAQLSLLRLQQGGLLSRKVPNGGHAEILDKLKPELSMPSDRRSRKLMFGDVRAEFPERDVWNNESLPFLQGSTTWYTDGSKIGNSTGAGIYCPALDVAQSVALGRYPTVFQAEVLAIQQAFHNCIECGLQDQNIVVCSDSQAALRAIQNPVVSSKVVAECKDLLLRVQAKNNVKLMWVPGHCGVAGNEKADELARDGSGTVPCGPEPFLPVSYATVKDLVRNGLLRKWRTQWQSHSGMRHSKACLADFDGGRSRDVISRSRRGARVIAAMCTGHGPFSAHLQKIGINVETTCCRFCGLEEETGWHVLMECPALWQARMRHLEFAVWTGQRIGVLRPSAFLRFAEDVGVAYE